MATEYEDPVKDPQFAATMADLVARRARDIREGEKAKDAPDPDTIEMADSIEDLALAVKHLALRVTAARKEG